MIEIVTTKTILGGKPRISGTRISVDVIADYITAGYGIEEIMRDYPHLTKKQVLTALSYIGKRVDRERMKLEPQTT